jgi:uncharacterized protein (UPF0335 family)
MITRKLWEWADDNEIKSAEFIRSLEKVENYIELIDLELARVYEELNSYKFLDEIIKDISSKEKLNKNSPTDLYAYIRNLEIENTILKKGKKNGNER